MNKACFPFVLTVLVAIGSAGCSTKPVLDSESSLFREYESLEQKLSTVRRHPDAGYNELLEQFIVKYNWNFDLSDIPDGIYEAFSVPDRYDYVHYLRLDIRNHRFENVYYDEFPSAGFGNGKDGKRESESYHKQMVRYGTKADLRIAYPLLEQELLERQDPLAVDGISGASLALHRLRIMIMKALYEHRNEVLLNRLKYELDGSVEFGF